MTTTYVYFAPHLDHTRFKIGIAFSPQQRLASLVDKFSINRTWLLECPTTKKAREAEKMLHFWFRAHQVTPHGYDGYTEWFSHGCWLEVLAFVQDNLSRLGGTRFFCQVPVSTRTAAIKVPGVSRKDILWSLLELGLTAAESMPEKFANFAKKRSLGMPLNPKSLLKRS